MVRPQLDYIVETQTAQQISYPVSILIVLDNLSPPVSNVHAMSENLLQPIQSVTDNAAVKYLENLVTPPSPKSQTTAESTNYEESRPNTSSKTVSSQRGHKSASTDQKKTVPGHEALVRDGRICANVERDINLVVINSTIHANCFIC